METKRRALVVLSIVFAVIGAITLMASAISAFFDRISEVPTASARRLVYQSDHAAVLQACRQVLADPQAAGFPKPIDGRSSVIGSQSGERPPAALPAALRDLNFEDMEIEDGRAIIFFGSGFGHWGYSTAPLAGESQRELIPGLWFWSEGNLARDLSRSPHFHASTLMLLAGLLALAVSIALAICSRRSVGVRTLQDTP